MLELFNSILEFFELLDQWNQSFCILHCHSICRNVNYFVLFCWIYFLLVFFQFGKTDHWLIGLRAHCQFATWLHTGFNWFLMPGITTLIWSHQTGHYCGTVITTLTFNCFKSSIWLSWKPLLGTSFSYPDPSCLAVCLWDCYILTSEVTEVVTLLLLDHL